MIREAWNFLNEASYDKIVEETGCERKCSGKEYKAMSKGSFDITWNSTKWISEFYLYSYSTGVIELYVILLIRIDLF